MARARNIKPGFFKNEDLAECSLAARLCFAGLWTLADREGRLEDRPKRIKAELFPFDAFEVEPLLAELARFGFVERYVVDDGKFIQVAKFTEHQTPHYSEKPSVIKPPTLQENTPHIDPKESKSTPGAKAASRGGHNPLNPDSLNPDSLNPEEKGAQSVSQGLPASAPADPPPEANGHAPTPAGLVCRAMRRAGLLSVNPGDPRLLALLAQGATEVEFVAIATEAVEKRKGWPWVLAVLQSRRAEAAEIALAPPPAVDPMAWAETQSGVNDRAARLGLEAWDGIRPWASYRRHVIAAHTAAQGATA